MKKFRFYTVMVALLLVSFSAFAGSVDSQRAKSLGEKFVEANFKYNTQLEWVYTTFTNQGRPSCHVFNAASGGFVIISACDLTSPVLGYSETGSFSTENIPDGLAYFLDGYGQSVDYAEALLQKPDFAIALEWANLERYGVIQLARTDVVAPMIATHWNQDCYYNASCPKDNDGPCGCAYAGCVATSMAQVLKYWNYPEHGTGSYTYNCPPYGDLSANFGSTTYLWDEMPESLSDDNPYVAIAIFHCGVSVNMFYGSYGSGALHQNIPSALSNYFGFATSHNRLRDDYTYGQWESMIHEALDAGVPILYGASSEAGSGHAFILDGYDTNGLIHINWSWGGELDGYFSIDNFHTYNQYWTMAQKMVADARPLGVYNNTPQAPTNFTAQPASDESYTCNLHWNNPTKTLNNANLTHIDQIVVKRDGMVIYTQNNVTPGTAMEITDEVSVYGLHSYQVYAVSDGYHGMAASQNDVRFGPRCTWTVECGTSGSAGWQGAAIEVLNNAMQVYGSVSPTTSSATFQVDVPLGYVSFAWVKGNSTVYDVSFTIRDAENQVVYAYSGLADDLRDGVFLHTNNNCGNSEDCGMPIDLYAYAEGDYVVLDWFDSSEAENYNVYRDGTLLATVSGQETGFIDEEPNYGGNCYFVTAFCASGESEPTNEACATVGEGCQPATNLWFEMTPNNKVNLTWVRPEHNDGLTQYVVYRTKESDMDWVAIKTVGPGLTSSIDNSALEDETFYLYKVVAYYQAIDCFSAPARSKYNEFDYFVRVYWSVDGVEETEKVCTEVFPMPGTDRMNIRTAAKNATLQVFDILGHKVIEQPLADELTTVSTEHWPSGMYFWKVCSDNKAETGKWVKE